MRQRWTRTRHKAGRLLQVTPRLRASGPSPATGLAGTWSLRCCGDTGTTPSMHGTRPRQRTATVTGVTAVMVPHGLEVRKQDSSQEPPLPPAVHKALGGAGEKSSRFHSLFGSIRTDTWHLETGTQVRAMEGTPCVSLGQHPGCIMKACTQKWGSADHAPQTTPRPVENHHRPVAVCKPIPIKGSPSPAVLPNPFSEPLALSERRPSETSLQ